MSREMKIMCGLPGSGKSTYVNRYLKGYTVICADDVRKALGHVFWAPLEPLVHAMCLTFARAVMSRGLPIVIDENNVRARYVRTWVETAKEFDYWVSVIRITTPIEVCKQRRSTGGFPLSVIGKMNQELEEDWPRITQIAPDLDFVRMEDEPYACVP